MITNTIKVFFGSETISTGHPNTLKQADDINKTHSFWNELQTIQAKLSNAEIRYQRKYIKKSFLK